MSRSRFLRTPRKLPQATTTAIAIAGIAAAAATAAGIVLAVKAFRHVPNRWAGKTVVITGGSRGLGLALAAQFADAGANLVLAARDMDELLRARQLLIDRNHLRNRTAGEPGGHASGKSRILLVPCDLTRRDDAESMIRAAHARWGRIDVLVNNAGIITVGPATTQTVEDFERSMDTNFYAMLYCTWAVLPEMFSRGAGDIINISSIGGKIAVPHMLPYSASKFAATGFSQGLHSEMKSKGIHVTTVCPGLLRTGSHLNAEFKGSQEDEYRWFSLGATLPFVSVDAARAARLIVAAAERRVAELIISPQAAVAARAAALMPGTTAAVLSLVNRMLPKAGGDDANVAKLGSQSRGKELKIVSGQGRAAATTYNEDSERETDHKIW